MKVEAGTGAENDLLSVAGGCIDCFGAKVGCLIYCISGFLGGTLDLCDSTYVWKSLLLSMSVIISLRLLLGAFSEGKGVTSMPLPSNSFSLNVANFCSCRVRAESHSLISSCRA